MIFVVIVIVFFIKLAVMKIQ